ncbi:MAG TPA: hypothetical protein VGR95_02315 [Thermoanaerobaculia bacterium]|nr:hypothetical protein [Thermoanaerobaculia bacterium]
MRRAFPLLLAIAACVVVALVWMGNDRTVSERAFDDFSIENTAPSGLSIAFRYLLRTGHHVFRLDTPLRPNLIPANAVLIRAGVLQDPLFLENEETKPRDKKKPTKKAAPRRNVVPLLSSIEDEWVRAGGRLILASPESFGTLRLRGEKRAMAAKVFPLPTTAVWITAPQARSIDPRTLPSHMHALFTINGAPAITREQIGNGDVILIAIPEFLQNEHIRWSGAVPLLETFAPANRPVYFDESIHGFDANGGSLELMKEWALGPFLGLLAIAALLYFWRQSKRIGPAEDDARETRSDAVDLVHSLGALYRESMTDEEALESYRDTLVRTVAAQSGLAGDALHRRVSDLTQHDTAAGGGGRRMRAAGFKRHLDVLNEAFRKLEHGREKRAAGALHANHR